MFEMHLNGIKSKPFLYPVSHRFVRSRTVILNLRPRGSQRNLGHYGNKCLGEDVRRKLDKINIMRSNYIEEETR